MTQKRIFVQATIESPTFGDLRVMAQEVEQYAKRHGDTLASAFTHTTFYCLVLLGSIMDSAKDQYVFGQKEIS